MEASNCSCLFSAAVVNIIAGVMHLYVLALSDSLMIV